MTDTEDGPALVPLAGVGELEIRKASWRSSVHELVSDAGPVGRVDHAIWSGKARARTADGEWGLSRVKGLRSSHVELTDGRLGAVLGRLELKTWTRGGRLLLDGRAYELHVEGWMRPTWWWQHDGVRLVEVDLPGSLGKRKGTARVTDAGREDRNVGLLLLLTLHVHTSAENGAAAAGAAASAGAVASS